MSQETLDKIKEWLNSHMDVDLESMEGYLKFMEYLESLVINQNK